MKKIRNNINGVLLLDKPLGISSNNAIQKVKYLLNAEKVGHTGTLDPMATGLLPICLGEATKFANFLLDGDKEYIATAQLGVVTDSGDSEGSIVATNEVRVDLAGILSVFTQFIGEITQIPPMYSALKHNGKPLYEYAREGVVIERQSRQVVIHELELIEYNQDLQQISFRTKVSKGTYIRTLAEDIGNILGCGASLVALRRTKTNEFDINAAYSIEQVELIESYTNLNILPVDVLCCDLPIMNITEDLYKYIKNGNRCRLDPADNTVSHDSEVRLYYQESFIGVAEILNLNDGEYILAPKRMLSTLS